MCDEKDGVMSVFSMVWTGLFVAGAGVCAVVGVAALVAFYWAGVSMAWKSCAGLRATIFHGVEARRATCAKRRWFVHRAIVRPVRWEVQA